MKLNFVTSMDEVLKIALEPRNRYRSDHHHALGRGESSLASREDKVTH